MGKEMLSIVATIEEELGIEIELFHEMKILLLKASEYDRYNFDTFDICWKSLVKI